VRLEQYGLQALLERIGMDAEPEVALVEATKAREKVMRYRGPNQEIATSLYHELVRFIWFLRTGIKPSGITRRELELYRGYCQRQVEAGRMETTVLDELAEWEREAER